MAEECRMARKLPKLGDEVVAQIEAAWGEPQADWARQRLLVVRLVAQHELTVTLIADVAGVCRQTVFTYRDTVVRAGVAGLLHRAHAGGQPPAVRGAVRAEFVEQLQAGKFRRAKDAQAWIKKRTRRTLTESGVRKVLRRLGGKLKVPRKSHTKKDPAKAAAFKVELPVKLEILAGVAARAGQAVRLWVLDEPRYGRLPVIRRVWGHNVASACTRRMRRATNGVTCMKRWKSMAATGWNCSSPRASTKTCTRCFSSNSGPRSRRRCTS
jgi:transposase